MFKNFIHKIERERARQDTNKVVRPFEWGVEFLNGIKSGPAHLQPSPDLMTRDEMVSALIQYNDDALGQSQHFFDTKSSVDYRVSNGWLSYESPIESPYASNNRAYARYFPASGLEKAGRVPRDGPDVRRAVLVIPQWNADSEGHVAICRLLNFSGISALRLTLPYHDRRMLPEFKRAEYLISSNVGRTIQACRQAVLDARLAIQWLAGQGYERIGILGTSIGSCIAFLTFVHEPLLKVGVYNHVSSYFGDAVWDGITTAHVREGLESTLTREEVRRVWAVISPNYYLGRLKSNPRRGLLLSGKYDLTFTPELTRLLFEECEKQGINYDRAVVPWGHYTMGMFPFKYYAGYKMIGYMHKYL
ncbi:MAG: hypothetical protein DMF61_12905 [Blastocatellia bacterium AA13]|nr:MAG: hypothetical protein DMF61_12905 [Blastocatellia bacterium AA13]